MNKVILMGRLTRDPEVRYSQGDNASAIARYSLAVDRKFNREQQSADFINCVAFGKAADGKATKIIIPSEIQGIAGLVKSVAEIAATEDAEEK